MACLVPAGASAHSTSLRFSPTFVYILYHHYMAVLIFPRLTSILIPYPPCCLKHVNLDSNNC
jgi:hypothetical protein